MIRIGGTSCFRFLIFLFNALLLFSRSTCCICLLVIFCLFVLLLFCFSAFPLLGAFCSSAYLLSAVLSAFCLWLLLVFCFWFYFSAFPPFCFYSCSLLCFHALLLCPAAFLLFRSSFGCSLLALAIACVFFLLFPLTCF